MASQQTWLQTAFGLISADLARRLFGPFAVDMSATLDAADRLFGTVGGVVLGAAKAAGNAVTGTAPKLVTQTANQTWLAGSKDTLAIAAGTFTDPQKSALTYSAMLATGAALPAWLTFNAATDTFSTTAAPTAAGTYSIKLTATDTLGLATSETFGITVIGAPVLAAQTATQYEVAGKAFSFALPGGTFTDPQGAKLTYAASLSSGAALPSWLTFNATTGTFSGTEPSPGAQVSVKVTATDSYGLSASETFAIAPANAPVLASQTAAQNWTQGQKITLALPASTFTDPQGSKLTYTASLSNGAALPSWLSFNATTETFTGTVPAGTAGFSVMVKATDSLGLYATDTFAVSTPAPAQQGLLINVNYDSSVTALSSTLQAQFKGAVNAAVSYLEAHFTNNVTLSLNFGYGEVGGTAMLAGALGENIPSQVRTPYSTVIADLKSAATSADDLASVGTLATTSQFSTTPFLVSRAEAKTLGLVGANDTSVVDGSIGLSSTSAFTYDPNNRAVAGDYDAIGTLEHEITEVMGRSGLLNVSNLGYTPLDLFRYTGSTGGLTHVTSQGPGGFSVDGKTILQTYNNPLNGGDAGDWTPTLQGDSFGSGYAGVAAVVSETDLREMDVLGWTRSTLPA